MIARTPERSRHRAAIKAERFKMLAGGTQLIAVGILGASVIAPTFNTAQPFSLQLASAGGAIASLIELVAWLLMRYGVAPSQAEQEDADA